MILLLRGWDEFIIFLFLFICLFICLFIYLSLSFSLFLSQRGLAVSILRIYIIKTERERERESESELLHAQPNTFISYISNFPRCSFTIFPTTFEIRFWKVNIFFPPSLVLESRVTMLLPCSFCSGIPVMTLNPPPDALSYPQETSCHCVEVIFL